MIDRSVYTDTNIYDTYNQIIADWI